MFDDEGLSDAIEFLEKEIDYIFDNETSFMNEFVPNRWESLADVYFPGPHIEIEYTTESCKKILSKIISIDDYRKWKSKNNS